MKLKLYVSLFPLTFSLFPLTSSLIGFHGTIRVTCRGAFLSALAIRSLRFVRGSRGVGSQERDSIVLGRNLYVLVLECVSAATWRYWDGSALDDLY